MKFFNRLFSFNEWVEWRQWELFNICIEYINCIARPIEVDRLLYCEKKKLQRVQYLKLDSSHWWAYNDTKSSSLKNDYVSIVRDYLKDCNIYRFFTLFSRFKSIKKSCNFQPAMCYSNVKPTIQLDDLDPITSFYFYERILKSSFHIVWQMQVYIN